MPKVVVTQAEEVMKSALWGASTRFGVPIILALVITGIPAHLIWASRVNDELTLVKRDVAGVVSDVQAIKQANLVNLERDIKVQADLAAVSTNVAAILRSIGRIETQMDQLGTRRQP